MSKESLLKTIEHFVRSRLFKSNENDYLADRSLADISMAGHRGVRDVAVYEYIYEHFGYPPEPISLKQWLTHAELGKSNEHIGLSDEQLRRLRRRVHSTVTTTDYIQEQHRFLRDETDYDSMIERFELAVEQDDVESTMALSRTIDNCSFQVVSVLDRVRGFENFGYRRLFGLTWSTLYHEIAAIYPSKKKMNQFESLGASYIARGNTNALFSADTILDPEGPKISDLVVIDPTALQIYDFYDGAEGLAYSERLAHFRSIGGENVTDSGVFVGRFIDYLVTMESLQNGQVEFGFAF